MFGKLLVQSLCGALDTHASQAYGSGAYDAIGVIFQRTVLFMLAHCVPITLVQLGVPELLRLAGEDPQLCALAAQYARRLLPSLYLEAFSRCVVFSGPTHGCCCRDVLPAAVRTCMGEERSLLPGL